MPAAYKTASPLLVHDPLFYTPGEYVPGSGDSATRWVKPDSREAFQCGFPMAYSRGIGSPVSNGSALMWWNPADTAFPADQWAAVAMAVPEENDRNCVVVRYDAARGAYYYLTQRYENWQETYGGGTHSVWIVSIVRRDEQGTASLGSWTYFQTEAFGTGNPTDYGLTWDNVIDIGDLDYFRLDVEGTNPVRLRASIWVGHLEDVADVPGAPTTTPDYPFSDYHPLFGAGRDSATGTFGNFYPDVHGAGTPRWVGPWVEDSSANRVLVGQPGLYGADSITQGSWGTINGDSSFYAGEANWFTASILSQAGTVATIGGYRVPGSTVTVAEYEAPSTATWEPLKIGAGGWVTGIDFDAAGTTFVIRTDCHGCWVGNPGAGEKWKRLYTSATMPAAFVATSQDWQWGGAYEVRVASSNPNRIWLVQGHDVHPRCFRSDDRGVTFAETAATFPFYGILNGNSGTYRTYGEKAAVDPANPDVFYAGTTTGGLYVTTDGGASWSNPLAAGTGVGVNGICFDPSSGTTGGRTNIAYACRGGTGVYRSDLRVNGGAWELLAGGPTSVRHAAVATDGYLYVTAGTIANAVYRWNGSAWATLTPGMNAHSITCDPFNAARIVAGYDGGTISISTDRGATWTGQIGTTTTQTRTATDVPWLGFAYERYMSTGQHRFDPTVQNRIWLTEGIGVWTTDTPTVNPTAWTSRSADIEQLTARDVIAPPGSANVIVGGMDRSLFVVPRANTAYPSRYGIQATPTQPLIDCIALDYSKANASHVVTLGNQQLDCSGFSLDSGANWTIFPTQPAGAGGDICCPNIDSILVITPEAGLRRSTDRGSSWVAVSGLPVDNAYLFAGWDRYRHILAVDGANTSTVYLFFNNHGIYRSTDSGATWTLQSNPAFDVGYSGNITDQGWHARLVSVPGQAGHLFWCAGQSGGTGATNPKGLRLWRSTDGGVTWATVSGFQEPYEVTCGKAAPGQSYPALYVVGWYNSVFGIWRSNDNAATWEQIGTYPYDSLDFIRRVAASQDVYGELYVAFNGSGWGKRTGD